MCGLIAMFEYRNCRPLDEEALVRMRDRMASRGPDGAGLWIDQEAGIGLAHRRLALIDLSQRGAQPLWEATGCYGIVFNGEIYNYRALRAELERRGRVFRTQTDTEVVLSVVAEYGVGGLTRLRGMFAFALWDTTNRRLLVARDPYGIKPLYYVDDGQTFLAGSQVKAILASGRIASSLDAAGCVGFHLWGSVPDPFTIWRSVRALPAGHFLWVDPERGSGSPTPYASVLTSFEGCRNVTFNVASTLRDAVLDSVHHHLEADVPVGIFLSSGIDSAVLTALVVELGAVARTVTLAFDEYRGTPTDEAPLAETVAAHYGTRHHTVRISRAEFDSGLDHLLHAMDQPTIDGVNAYFVSRATAQVGLKAALSGLGGDELFGGYPSFREIPRLVGALRALPLPSALRVGIGRLLRHIRWAKFSPKFSGLLEYGGNYPGAYLLRRGLFLPWEIAAFFDPEFVHHGLEELATLCQLNISVANIRSPHAKVGALESIWYLRNQLLRDADWASMAHGVEIRVPFVDSVLLNTLGPAVRSEVPPTKQDLAMVPQLPLPPVVLNRPKTGFNVPVRTWTSASQAKWRGLGYRPWARRVFLSQSAA